MKTRYSPCARELRRFASQFTEEEWQLLCKYPPFMNFVLTSIGRAAYHAAVLLKKPVQFAYLKETVSEELAERLLDDSRQPLSLKLHTRKT